MTNFTEKIEDSNGITYFMVILLFYLALVLCMKEYNKIILFPLSDPKDTRDGTELT